MSNRNKPPEAIDIVEYWDNQPLIELKDIRWNPMVDIGEPSCQACGCWSPEWDIGKLTGSYEEDKPVISERWERSGLEKAHIVAHSLGGANSPSNFLMLCRSCHFDFDSEITTTSRKKMLKVYTWLSERKMNVDKKQKQVINKMCEKSGMSEEKIARGFHMKSIVDDIFDENQKLQLEIKEEERAEKYNSKAKNLNEMTEMILDECIAIAEIAREDQMRLDLDIFEWYDIFKKGL
jgi:hypothetical protein